MIRVKFRLLGSAMGNSIENFPIEIARAFSHRLCWWKFKVEIAIGKSPVGDNWPESGQNCHSQLPIADLKVAWNGQMPNAYPKMTWFG